MKKIIIADNNDPEIQTLSGILKDNDFVVYIASSAEDALSLHLKYKADMIIADLDVEVSGGDGLANKLKENEEMRKGVYIILICNGRKADLERCGKSGVNSYVKRPVIPNDLLQRIRSVATTQYTRATRVLVKVDVKSLYHNESFFCTSKNLSISGILLESDKIMAKGDEISLSFFLPDEERVGTTGKVMRIARGGESRYVYGVEFVSMEDEHRAIIEKFVDHQREEGNFY